VVFLISDFLDDGYLPALRSVNRRHDVVAVQITDERERALTESGLLMLEDAETGETRLVDTTSEAFRRAAATASEQQDKALLSGLRSAGIDVVRVDATRSVVDPLLAFFRMRERRQRR
jgi:uncharacterized protein (DUF58 family)